MTMPPARRRSARPGNWPLRQSSRTALAAVGPHASTRPANCCAKWHSPTSRPKTSTWRCCPPEPGTGPTDRHFLCATPITERSMAKEKTLEDLFHETLKDIYYAERKILKALPKMARGAEAQDLKAAFEKHKEQTEGHVERLQQVFELFGKRAQGKTCPAIDGIIEEGEEIMADFKGTPALDAGLISAAQAVEHYEITRYGTLK